MKHDALLAAVLASPDDDQLRQVLADALEEQGDPRGEMISVQCALARLESEGSEDDDAREALEQRNAELFADHGEKWVLESGVDDIGFTFRRGFVEEVELSAKQLATRIERLVTTTPLRSISLTRVDPQFLAAALPFISGSHVERLRLAWCGNDAIELLSQADLTRVKEIDLLVQPATVELVASKRLTSLERLRLFGYTDDDTMLAVLRGISQPLVSLSLDTATPPMMQVIARAAWARSLRRLSFVNTRVGTDGFTALATSQNLGQLREIDVTATGIKGEGIVALGRAKAWPLLEVLRVGSNDFDAATIAYLCAMPGLANLRELSLAYLPVGDDGARALARSPFLKNLRVLDLGGCKIGPRGIAELATSETLRSLRKLELHDCPLMDEGAIALARSPHLGALRELGLAETSMGDEGAVAIAQAVVPRLRTLDLQKNPFGEAGAKALAAAPHFDHVRSFDLREVRFGRDGGKALRKRFGDAVHR